MISKWPSKEGIKHQPHHFLAETFVLHNRNPHLIQHHLPAAAETRCSPSSVTFGSLARLLFVNSNIVINTIDWLWELNGKDTVFWIWNINPLRICHRSISCTFKHCLVSQPKAFCKCNLSHGGKKTSKSLITIIALPRLDRFNFKVKCCQNRDPMWFIITKKVKIKYFTVLFWGRKIPWSHQVGMSTTYLYWIFRLYNAICLMSFASQTKRTLTCMTAYW